MPSDCLILNNTIFAKIKINRYQRIERNKKDKNKKADLAFQMLVFYHVLVINEQ